MCWMSGVLAFARPTIFVRGQPLLPLFEIAFVEPRSGRRAAVDDYPFLPVPDHGQLYPGPRFSMRGPSGRALIVQQLAVEL